MWETREAQAREIQRCGNERGESGSSGEARRSDGVSRWGVGRGGGDAGERASAGVRGVREAGGAVAGSGRSDGEVGSGGGSGEADGEGDSYGRSSGCVGSDARGGGALINGGCGRAGAWGG